MSLESRIQNWDEYFIRLSRLIALKSKDRSKAVGAVIVGEDMEIISTGYNGFPRGMEDNLDVRHQRPEKYELVVHAETNAIINAARVGVSVKGASMYMESAPCRACAHDIINAGIKRLVVCPMNPEFDQFAGDENWDKNRHKAILELEEAGVEIVEVPISRKEFTL